MLRDMVEAAKAMAEALAAVRACVEKNCASSSRLSADLEIAEGMLRISTDMGKTLGRKDGDPAFNGDIKALRKRAEALLKKARKAGATASEEMCALGNCKKQWENLSKVKAAQERKKLDDVRQFLCIMEQATGKLRTGRQPAGASASRRPSSGAARGTARRPA